jgi:hypothetical protein
VKNINEKGGGRLDVPRCVFLNQVSNVDGLNWYSVITERNMQSLGIFWNWKQQDVMVA